MTSSAFDTENKSAENTAGERIDIRLAMFFREIMEQALDGSDIDISVVYDTATKFGLLIKKRYDPAIHGSRDYDVGEGDYWYLIAPDFPRSPATPPDKSDGSDIAEEP